MKLMSGITITMGLILMISSIIAFAIAGFADGYYIAIGGFLGGILMIPVGYMLEMGD